MRHWRFFNATFFSFILCMNNETAIAFLAQVIISRHEKIEIQREQIFVKKAWNIIQAQHSSVEVRRILYSKSTRGSL